MTWDAGLYVSPCHAMFIAGILVPARALVDGVGVVQMAGVEHIEYLHLELDTHDVIVAEGALSETFIDDDSRASFHNASEYAVLYPGAAAGIADPGRYCAPRIGDGPQLEAIPRALRRARPAVAA